MSKSKKTNDVLKQKRKELADCQNQVNNAISLVTNTVKSLNQINESIEAKVKEIEEYQSELDLTRNGLKDTKDKNERIIKNFNALLEIGE